MIPQTQLVIPQWLALSMPVRLRLKKIFSIPKSEGVNSIDGRVVSDGHTHPDLAHISLPAMEAYVGYTFDGDFFAAFETVLVKVEGEMAAEAEAKKPVPAEAPQPITLKVGDKTFIAHEVTGIVAAPEPEKPVEQPKKRGGRKPGSKNKKK